MNDTQKYLVGKRISRIRDKHDKTLEQFGEIIDHATKSNVSKWEKGEVLPNRKRLKLIADYDGIHVNELLYGELNFFAEHIFIDEVRNFYAKYNNKDKGSSIINLFNFEEVGKEFDNWLNENKENFSYDDENKIREIIKKFIDLNLKKHKEDYDETQTSSIEKIKNQIYAAQHTLEKDFFYGIENDNAEIELVLRNGMTKEVYEAADSILNNTAIQLLTLEEMLNRKNK